MIVSLSTRKPVKANSPEVKLAAPNIEISGNKVIIPIEEYERIRDQARFYKESFSMLLDTTASQAKVINDYVKM